MKSIRLVISAIGIIGASFIVDANPVLTPGVWTRITPTTQGATNLMAIDPSNPGVLYLTASHGSRLGLLKSTDGGSTWNRIGNPPASPDYGDTVDYLDSPFKVRVDPANSQHMYATQMSPGGTVTQGFWVTNNGGAKWVRTKGFMDAVRSSNGTTDVGHFDVDPTDFNHVIVSCHYYWNGSGASGIYETKDGGNTFIAHTPASGMGSASKSVCFLYEPTLGIGNKDTWLVVEDMSNMWRTTDAGATWTEVFIGETVHGGTITHCYTRGGAVYTGGFGSPVRSTNNGATWTHVSNAPYAYHSSVATDGSTLYINGQGSNASGMPWYSSPETDGDHWTKYAGSALPTDGGGDIQFDPVNRIVYSVNGASGLWALKVSGTATAIAEKKSALASPAATAMIALRMVKTGIAVRTAAGSFYDVKGRYIIKAGYK